MLRALRGAVDALETQDVELCDEVIAFDDEIDDRYHRIEKLVEELLALADTRSPAICGSCSPSSTTRSISSESATSRSPSPS